MSYSSLLFSQGENKIALNGNNNYNTGIKYLDMANMALSSGDSVKYNKLNEEANKHFLDAEVDYKKALQKKQDFLKADFNLGDALYKQGRYDESISKFDEIINKTNNPVIKGSSYHNIGNAHLQKFMKDPQNNEEELEQSIESYKNALRNNPGDNEARYNLEMAKRLKQQQQQQQQQQQKDGDKNQEQKDNQDQQDQEQKKKDQEKKEGDKKEQQKKEENEDDKNEEEQQQPKEGEITKEEAERLLEALKNEEEKLQDKLKKKKVKGGKVYIEKDW